MPDAQFVVVGLSEVDADVEALTQIVEVFEFMKDGDPDAEFVSEKEPVTHDDGVFEDERVEVIVPESDVVRVTWGDMVTIEVADCVRDNMEVTVGVFDVLVVEEKDARGERETIAVRENEVDVVAETVNVTTLDAEALSHCVVVGEIDTRGEDVDDAVRE